MSTIGAYKLSVQRPQGESTEVESYQLVNRVIRSYSEAMSRPDSMKFRDAGRSLTSAVADKRKLANPKRRLRGFLVEMQPDNARVAFVDNGQTVLYDLPAEHLRNAGITVQNQPFQMDETENKDEDGAWCVGYRFLALAKPSDAEIDVLQFDEERKRKRDIIFQEFSNPQT